MSNKVNFTIDELRCKCCGRVKFNYNLLIYLQAIRDAFQRPIIVNSAFRCEKHNKEIGGSPTSCHMQGNAVDITSANPKDIGILQGIVMAFWKIYPLRVGLYKNFVHIDVCHNKNNFRLWIKDVDRKIWIPDINPSEFVYNADFKVQLWDKAHKGILF